MDVAERFSFGIQGSSPLILSASLWCPEGDLNPHTHLRAADFKSAA